jgi:hypothetical protein
MPFFELLLSSIRRISRLSLDANAGFGDSDFYPASFYPA